MNNKATKYCKLLLAGLVFSTSFGQRFYAQDTLNESNASEIPFEWEAEGQLTMNIVNNIRILNLQDNVVLFQGTLVIKGDTAIIEYDVPTGEFIKATVFGSPVNYTQQLGSNESQVNGTSDSIEFYSAESTGDQTVELSGNAHIESPDSTISCAVIVYLPSLDLIPSTTGPCAGTFSQ